MPRVDWRTFIANIVASIAWPTTVIVLALAFRRSLVSLMPSLHELEYGKFKMRFAKDLSEAASKAEQLKLPQTAQPEMAKEISGVRTGQTAEGEALAIGDLRLIALTSPVGVVLQSWVPVEYAITQLAERAGIPTAVPIAFRELKKRGLIPEALQEIIDNLRRMRNEAAHYPSFAIDVQQAVEYADLAKRVAA